MEQVDMQTIHIGQMTTAKPVRRWWTRSVRRAIMWGAVSAAVYFLVFANQDDVTKYFTRGGVYTVAIIGTALAVSLIHSAFANYVLETLGIRPSGKGGH